MRKCGFSAGRKNAVHCMFVASLLATAPALAGCGSGGGSASNPPVAQPSLVGVVATPSPPSTPAPTVGPSTPPITSTDLASSAEMVAANWEIGPIINGKNYSVGMPASPTQTSEGWAFDFPLSPGSVHYLVTLITRSQVRPTSLSTTGLKPIRTFNSSRSAALNSLPLGRPCICKNRAMTGTPTDCGGGRHLPLQIPSKLATIRWMYLWTERGRP